jgi:hypothetical protein
LEVTLVRSPGRASGTQTGWDAGVVETRVGPRTSEGWGGFFSWEFGREATAWTETAERIDALLAKGAADDPISIRGHLVGTK